MLVYLGDIAGASIMESDGRSACQPIMTCLLLFIPYHLRGCEVRRQSTWLAFTEGMVDLFFSLRVLSSSDG